MMKLVHRSHIQNIFAEIICEATRGKYEEFDERKVSEFVTLTLFAIDDAPSGRVPQTLTVDFSSDVRNQTICLEFIYSHWSIEKLRPNALETIHAVAYGSTINSSQLRRTNFVEDFSGELKVSPTDIPSQLIGLNKFLAISDQLRFKDLNEKCLFLAELNGRLIGIHPFQDGNGRVARFATLLVLSRWNLPWFSTPKVRNDLDWKQALDKAVKGDYGALAQQYEMRITKQLESPL